MHVDLYADCLYAKAVLLKKYFKNPDSISLSNSHFLSTCTQTGYIYKICLYAKKYARKSDLVRLCANFIQLFFLRSLILLTGLRFRTKKDFANRPCWTTQTTITSYFVIKNIISCINNYFSNPCMRWYIQWNWFKGLSELFFALFGGGSNIKIHLYTKFCLYAKSCSAKTYYK